MKDYLKNIYKLIEEKNYDEALDDVNQAIKYRALLHPILYLLKAKLIELTESEEYSFKDIEKNFRKALSIDKNYIDAIVDYADFCFYIKDNTEEANKMYLKAKELNDEKNLEILSGINECINEFEQKIVLNINPKSFYKIDIDYKDDKSFETKKEISSKASFTYPIVM